jgi:hypothetical protein
MKARPWQRLGGSRFDINRSAESLKSKHRHRSRLAPRPALLLEPLEPRWAFAIDFGSTSELIGDPDSNPDDPIMSITNFGPSLPTLTAFESTEALQQYVLDAAMQQYGDLFGQPTWGGGWWGHQTLDNAAFLRPSASETQRSQAGTADLSFSNTNVQVAGVDEGDLVKTDGSFLYYLADGDLSIIDVRDPSRLQVVSRLPQHGDAWPSELYVIEDRLTLVAPTQRTGMPGVRPINPGVPSIRPAVLWDRWMEPWEPVVQITTYDITDRAAPQLLQTTEIDGQLVETRLVDNTLILVMQEELALSAPVSFPVPKSGEAPESEGDSPDLSETEGKLDEPLLFLRQPVSPLTNEEMALFALSEPRLGIPWFEAREEYVYESRESYIARVQEELDPSRLLPMMRTTVADGSVFATPLLDATQIHHSPGSTLTNLLSVVLVDIGQPQTEPISASAALVQAGSHVYVTTDSVYVAATHWDVGEEQTTLFRFAVSESDVTYSAAGVVPGRPLNQFAMDAYNDFFRIATTRGWGDDASNGLYVLDELDGQLNVVGALDRLAPGETIFSARFFGDRAFLVTFRTVDPLFAIDLSDPTTPTVAGELKIPGFSHYLHGVGKDHLFGLGRDADVETGRAGEPQLSLFDVSDLTQPSVVDQTLIELTGNGWSHSDAFFDHHAVSYFPSSQILVVPFHESGWETVDDATGRPVEQWYVRHNFWVFHLDPTEGEGAIEVLGQIAHGSPAMRSVRIGDVLYTLSVETVQAHSLLDPSNKRGEVSLVSPLADDMFWVSSGTVAEPLDVLVNDRTGSFETGSVITSVTEPVAGGSVVVAADGLSLLYTAADGFVGLDSFEYTYEGESAHVLVHVQAVPERVRVRLEVTDASGQPISLVELGSEFQVNVWLEDSAEQSAPLTGAFVDVQFDARMAKAAGSFSPGSGFTVGNRFDSVAAPGRITNVGGFAVADVAPGGNRLLARIPMLANDLGKMAILADRPEFLSTSVTDSADQYLNNAAIEFEAVQVRIIDGFHNAKLASDVNADTFTTPQDALLVVNFLTRHGMRVVEDMRSLLTAEGEDFAATAANGVFNRYLDSNNDRHVTPIDILLVINRINRQNLSRTSSAVGEGEPDASGLTAALSLADAVPFGLMLGSPAIRPVLQSRGPEQSFMTSAARTSAVDAVLMTTPRQTNLAHLVASESTSLDDHQAATDTFFAQFDASCDHPFN